MNTPDIPQECGLHEYDGTWQGGGAYFDIRQKQGRAALAAYCMAVIDVMIWDFQFSEYAKWCTTATETYCLMEYERFLFAWRAEWSRYGGFQG